MREDALDFRKKAEEEMLKNLFEKKEMTPKTYNVKVKKLAKWVLKEKFEINKQRKNIQKGFNSTSETIKRTQRDINYMRKMFSKYGILDSKTIKHA